jgi:glutaryl-CoA dehydrogenase
MKPYDAPDFFDINSHLTEDERMIRDTVRQFVSKEIIPIIEKHHREGTFPKHLIPQIA